LNKGGTHTSQGIAVTAKERCLFYRDSEGLAPGRDTEHYDLNGGQTVCDRDSNSCEKTIDLKEYQNEQEHNEKDRRQYPRFLLDLPLEYLMSNTPKTHGGLVVNVSEGGLLIRSIRNMPIGTELKIAVLFPKGYELANFEGLGKIIRKDLVWEEDWEGYEYGLKFTWILEQDRRKLRQVLGGQYSLEEVF
jgi:PilZ domain